MTPANLKNLIDTDPDFVNLKKFDFSLKKCLEYYTPEKYPDGIPTKIIAQALALTEEEVSDLYLSVVQKLRQIMKVE